MLTDSTEKFKLVLDQFSPGILGAFWITEEELSRELPGFDELNYLFDGLLSQYLYGRSEEILPKANSFFTENFAEKMFLSHIQNKGDISAHLDEQIAILKPDSNKDKIILVLNQSSKDWSSELQKRYPQFIFKKLNY